MDNPEPLSFEIVERLKEIPPENQDAVYPK